MAGLARRALEPGRMRIAAAALVTGAVLASAGLPPAVAGAAPAAPHDVDACGLLTDAEVAGYLQRPVLDVSGTRHFTQHGRDFASCIWTFEFTDSLGFTYEHPFTVAVYDRPEGDLAGLYGTDADSTVEPVSGIGDAAWLAYTTVRESEGDALVERQYGYAAWTLVAGTHVVGIAGGILYKPDSGRLELLRLVVERLPQAGGAPGPPASPAPAEREHPCDGFAEGFRGFQVSVDAHEATLRLVGPDGDVRHDTDWGTDEAVETRRQLRGSILTVTARFPQAPATYDGVHVATAQRDGETCTARFAFTVDVSASCVAVTEALDARGHHLVVGVTDEPLWGIPSMFGTDPRRFFESRERFVGTDRLAVVLVPTPEPGIVLERLEFDGHGEPPRRHPGVVHPSGWALGTHVLPDRSPVTGTEAVVQRVRISASLRIPPAVALRLAGGGTRSGGGPSLSSAPTCSYELETEIVVRHEPWLWQCYEPLGPCRVARRTHPDANWGQAQAAGAYLEEVSDTLSVFPTPVGSATDAAVWIGMEAIGTHAGPPGYELDKSVRPRYCSTGTRAWALDQPPCR